MPRLNDPETEPANVLIEMIEREFRTQERLANQLPRTDCDATIAIIRRTRNIIFNFRTSAILKDLST